VCTDQGLEKRVEAFYKTSRNMTQAGCELQRVVGDGQLKNKVCTSSLAADTSCWEYHTEEQRGTEELKCEFMVQIYLA
jgi:hypothetical protein